jgi:hypothetical protein
MKQVNMKQTNTKKQPIPKMFVLYTICLLAVLSVAAVSIKPVPKKSIKASRNNAITTAKKDSLDSQQAFLAVYKVLMSPRCMNCHPSGDIPLQGDDSHLHTQGVKRGEDGKGLYALKCANCHQSGNTPGLNMPPGNPNWHLPPADMRMVFQGKSPQELAAQLKDPNKNGHKTLQQLIKHVSSDTLVMWGWNPGDGRTKPPMAHAEFAKQFKEWISKGAVVPD